jgi:iron complex outermembrane receptor protein
VPRTKIRGYEGELYLKPADWLTMGGSLTYTDAKFTKNQSIVFGLPVFYGPFGDVPKWSGSVYADAKMELPNDLGSLNYHVDIYAQTAFYFSNLGGTIQPGTRLPGYELVNMRLDWANMFGSNVKGGIFVKNLTDKLYYTGGSAGAQNFSVESATFGSPRTYGVSMRIDF